MDDSIEGVESEGTAKVVMAGVVTVVLGTVLATEAPTVLVVLAGVLGVFAVVGPLVWFLAKTGAVDGIGGSEADDAEAALDRLRRRYADGELTDDEFERRLDRLLETETLADAKVHRTDATQPTDRELDAELDR
ncbi:SHOCT domain-containing protein [Halorussus halobius]|uniref:SHOCT domain-containing protein n=1 Tax=Halorussus halobius TaxID=1710537 RepID=UPI001092EA2F|nr:SHOCT domain-containing protein [Halorussus halobius]